MTGGDCFSLLVVGVDPSYFNNNQWAWQATVFLYGRLYWFACWLWSNLQAASEAT